MSQPRFHGLAGACAMAMLAACAAVRWVPAQAATSDTDVKTVAGLLATDAARLQGLVDKNDAVVERALADELYYVHSMGVMQTKAGHYGDFHSRHATYNKITIKEASGRLYGDVGVLHGVMDFSSGPAGSPTKTFRYSNVYVWRDHRWQMISFQVTTIQDMPARGGGRPGGPAGPADSNGAPPAGPTPPGASAQ